MIIEIAKLGTYNGFEFTTSIFRELMQNSEDFPIVNGHETANERRYEATGNWGRLIGMSQNALLAELEIDETSELGILYEQNKYRKWSLVLNRASTDSGLYISELGLLGNRAPAIRNLREVTRYKLAYSENMNYKIEVNMTIEELKTALDAIVAEIAELKKTQTAQSAELEALKYPPKTEGDEKGEPPKAEDEGKEEPPKAEDDEIAKLKEENAKLKEKIAKLEESLFSEVISAYDEKIQGELKNFKPKFAEDIDGFKAFAALLQPKKKPQPENLNAGQTNTNKTKIDANRI